MVINNTPLSLHHILLDNCSQIIGDNRYLLTNKLTCIRQSRCCLKNRLFAWWQGCSINTQKVAECLHAVFFKNFVTNGWDKPQLERARNNIIKIKEKCSRKRGFNNAPLNDIIHAINIALGNIKPFKTPNSPNLNPRNTPNSPNW